jgi:hypothetical protein
MVERVSETDSNLILLDELQDFQKHALQAVQEGYRRICIVSDILDEPVYNTDAFRDAVRNLAIRDRFCQVRILVKNIKPAVEHGHRLLELARRLSSKVEMRKLTVAPKDKDQGWLIVDNATLLCKYNDTTYNGYVDYDARPKCKVLLDEFKTLWELYGEVDPSLRYQLI